MPHAFASRAAEHGASPRTKIGHGKANIDDGCDDLGCGDIGRAQAALFKASGFEFLN